MLLTHLCSTAFWTRMCRPPTTFAKSMCLWLTAFVPARRHLSLTLLACVCPTAFQTQMCLPPTTFPTLLCQWPTALVPAWLKFLSSQSNCLHLQPCASSSSMNPHNVCRNRNYLSACTFHIIFFFLARAVKLMYHLSGLYGENSSRDRYLSQHPTSTQRVSSIRLVSLLYAHRTCFPYAWTISVRHPHPKAAYYYLSGHQTLAGHDRAHGNVSKPSVDSIKVHKPTRVLDSSRNWIGVDKDGLILYIVIQGFLKGDDLV